MLVTAGRYSQIVLFPNRSNSAHSEVDSVIMAAVSGLDNPRSLLVELRLTLADDREPTRVSALLDTRAEKWKKMLLKHQIGENLRSELTAVVALVLMKRRILRETESVIIYRQQ
ncbi:hypothetical protein EB796_004488 [Bugula neritina]|uniref:Uncharacterized protein n=1 Tax=Bugula neritina TaxID=10212 RepID=A0A7J7KEZ7_BUGNE|nr:hypothetical protein EB796_004488 [Bugula neritina]